MRGITKAFSRAPHRIGTKVGMAHTSSDPQFDELARRFTTFEKSAEKLKKDAAGYNAAVQTMLVSGAAFGTNFQTLFSPLSTEGDMASAFPDATRTIEMLPEYDTLLAELRDTLTPEIDLIENRVVGPMADFHAVCVAIRKNMTKREHKLVDYDRRKNSFEKLKNKKDKSLKDEQNLFKLEQEYETSVADYEYFNNTLKEELPQFFELAASLVNPLFHSFYYMQLNVMYLTLDRLQSFAQGRFDIDVPPAQIEQDYQTALGDTAETLQDLTISKPATSSVRVMAANGRTLGPSRSTAGSHGMAANAPSKGGGLAGRSGSSIGKKAPPPPIPKKKPGLGCASPEYVIALYDYKAQADGDLTFAAGDRIEVVQRTPSQDDWWTGVINGAQGIFPGNYVRDP